MNVITFADAATNTDSWSELVQPVADEMARQLYAESKVAMESGLERQRAQITALYEEDRCKLLGLLAQKDALLEQLRSELRSPEIMPLVPPVDVPTVERMEEFIGRTATVRGLSSRPDLSYMPGIVLGYDPGSHRFAFELSGPRRLKIAIKFENLVFHEEFDAADDAYSSAGR